MIPVIVMTSDKYMLSLRPFMYLFNKHWGWFQEARILCFKKPNFYLPDNFSIYSLGDMANYPVNRWSNAIIDYLNLHPQIGHFILMLEDYWITRTVDYRSVELLYQYAIDHPEVIKVDLCADRQFAAGAKEYGKLGDLDLVQSDCTSQYHMSLMTGIWNRNQFMKIVIPDESPWQVELEGTNRLAALGDEVLVVGTKQWPLKHTLAHRSGDPTKFLLDDLSEEDLNEITKLGLLKTESDIFKERWEANDGEISFIDPRYSST